MHRPLAIAAVLICVLTSASVRAQTAWEFSPYVVRVWVAVDDPAELSGPAVDRLCQRVEDLAAAHVGAPWSLSATPVPAALAGELLTRIEAIEPEQILADAKLAVGFDKLMLVKLSREHGHWRILVRELDVATRQLSPALQRNMVSDESLATEVAQAIVEIFSPLAVVKRVEDQSVEVRLRAAGLTTDDASPVLLAPGAPLAVVLRSEDRLGRAQPGGVRVLPWTLLQAQQRDGAKLQCRLHSAQRKALSNRASLRVKRYALAVRPQPRATLLTLQTPGDAPQPLVDYELVEQDETTKATTVVGRTDADGRIAIDGSDSPFRVLYIRHGEQLLARLPLVPGWQQHVIAPVNNDDARLAAAAFVATLKLEIVDTVARRQILAARLQRRIDSGAMDEAKKLLEQFQRLPTHHDFAQRLETARTKFAGNPPRTQEHIDKLFAEAADALKLYLDPKELDRLQSQLAQGTQP